MKIFSYAPFLLSSALVAATAGAKPFGTLLLPARAQGKPNIISTQATSALTVRGGDLGPLTADTAAKALVGYSLLNGWTIWQATEGTLKLWGFNKVTEKQKLLFEAMGANMFFVAIAGVALLKGQSLSTALGISTLLSGGLNVSWLIDDVPGKIGLPKEAVMINAALSFAVAYANLLNQDWASAANKLWAAYYVVHAASGVLTGKFKEMWTFGGEGAVAELGADNLIWSTVSGATFACYAAFSEEPALKVIAYSHIPWALLSCYNALISESAKEIVKSDATRYVFGAFLVVMLAAILL